MNSSMKGIFFLLGGIALGVAGTVAANRDKLNIKPLAAEILSRGLDAKACIASKAEVVKEDVKDILSGAKNVASKRKDKTDKA